MPGKNVTCLVRAKRIAVTCDTRVKAAREGLLLEVYKVGKSRSAAPTQFTAMGIAPDRATGVRVKIGRRSTTIPVIDNAFDHTAKIPIEIIHLRR